jgi:hypothetical protein
MRVILIFFFVAIGLLVSLWLKVNLNTFKHLESECKCKISPDTFHIKYIIFQPNLNPPPPPPCADKTRTHRERQKNFYEHFSNAQGHNNFIPWYSTIYKIIANRPATTGLRAALDIFKTLLFLSEINAVVILRRLRGALKKTL